MAYYDYGLLVELPSAAAGGVSLSGAHIAAAAGGFALSSQASFALPNKGSLFASGSLVPAAPGPIVGASIPFAAGTIARQGVGWGIISQSSGAFPAPYLFGSFIRGSAHPFGEFTQLFSPIAGTNMPAGVGVMIAELRPVITGVGSHYAGGDPSASWSSSGYLSGVHRSFAAGSFVVTHVP